MSVNSQQKYKELVSAVVSYDSCKVQRLLCENCPVTLIDQRNDSLLHLICRNFFMTFKDESKGIILADSQNFANLCDIIYMLVDAGVDLNLKDMDGNTCLIYAVEHGNFLLCDILLQCGADMWVVTKYGDLLYDYVLKLDACKEMNLQNTFKKFYPGLWKAVESEDIYQIRKLINLWCKTDLCRNGITLKDIAFQTGHEGIISLILGIFKSMELVYHILAKNTKAINQILETSQKQLRLDLRKMSERGAPILYYLIQSKDVSTIKLFIKYGCPVYTVMQDECGFDMPVLFTALKPDMPVEIIEALLPKNRNQQEEMLYKLLYKGKSVLEVALEQNINIGVFSTLIDRGGPLLLMDRNQFNQSVKDVAILANKKHYVKIIEDHVSSWVFSPRKYPNRRRYLALYGWDFKTIIAQNNEEQCEESSSSQEFLSHVGAYQEQIKFLAKVVETNDTEKFNQKKIFKQKWNLFESNLSWHGRVMD